MKILITGSNGLLGQKLINKLLLQKDIDLIATSKGQNRLTNQSHYKYISLDITDRLMVEKVLISEKPEVVINTAAMTNVDACEDLKQQCDKLNVFAVKYLADACLILNAHLIHISTDFIFDGENGPYREDDTPNPLSYYGDSKLRSEKILINHKCRWSILRTIILFGVAENLTKSNIVLWAKETLDKNQTMNIIDDQYRAPTLAEDLADACISCFQKEAYGIYHVSGKDIMSIFEIVQNIAKHYGYDTNNINKISTKSLGQKAKRPMKTGFILDKANEILSYNPHSFLESLDLIDQQLNTK